MPVSFDDLIPKQPAQRGVTFDDLIPATPPRSPSASPTVAVNPVPAGGAAAGTVLDPMGGDIGSAIMGAAAPAPTATFRAGTPGYSVMGNLPPPPAMPVGVTPEAIAGVREELLRSNPQQRVALASSPTLRGRVAQTLLQTEAASLAPRESVIQNTPISTQIGMDISRAVSNPAARGVIAGISGLGQVLPGVVQAGADLVGADSVSNFAGRAARAADQVAQPLRPAGGTDQLVFDVFNSITQSTPTLAVGLAGGPAMTFLFGQSAAQQYTEGRSRGLSGDDAAMRAGIMAGAEVLGERIGFGEQMKLLKGITGGLPIDELAPTFAREVVKNATGEQLTTLTQFLADKYGPGALNTEATLADYLLQVCDTLKVSLGQSAVMAGGPAVIQRTRETMRQQEASQLAGAPDMPAQQQPAAAPTVSFDDLIPPQANQPDPMGRVEPTLGEPQQVQLTPAAPADQPQPQGAPDELRQEGQEAAQAVTEPAPAVTPPATDTQRVSTVTGRQIDTRLRVVDASELQAATGDLQPRDRTRAASDEQINAIASQLDPQRLGTSAEADRGAPIIGPDMIVESGNGRVQGIRRAYQMFPERAQAYRDYLQSLGYDTTGMAEPVLVRERVTPFSPEDRIAFVQEANQAATMDLSPVERARIDVSALADDVVEVWRGGEITDAANRDFVRAFIGKLPQAQRNGMMDDTGALSPDGAQRIRRAMLAGAYGDRDLLSRLIESTDDGMKSIGNALFDYSGQWMQMRRMAERGVIDGSYDVTADLVQAARVVDQLKQTRGRVQEWLAQTDLTGERNPVVDAFVTAFYNAPLTKAVGREAIGDVLQAYIDGATSQDTEGLFGAPPAPAEIVEGAVERRNERAREPASGNLFADAAADAQGDAGARQGVQPGGRPARDRVVQGGRTRADGGRQANADEGRAGGRRAPDQDRDGQANQAQEGVDRGANRDTEGDAPADRRVQARTPENRRAENQRVKGAVGDIFNAASFTNRQSIYRDAFVELGHDPAEAELWPPAKQFNTLSEGLKKTYGLSVVEKSKPANLRDAIDQLLDAYRGLQLMAHVLDLPTSAIGLNGELGLGLVKGAGYLGAHYPLGTGDGRSSEGIATAGQTIVMPGRSNSFAHEWGHALDFYLAAKHGDAMDNLSDYLRAGETLADKFPELVGDSFRHLMNSIFFDQADQSAQIMELERKMEKAQQKGGDTKKLEADLAKLRSGASRAIKGRSKFYRDAGDFAKATGSDPDYWRKPTEMLARSFEAYVAHKVEAAGGTTEFITKGDYAYTSDAHIRLEKTFPKDADRFNIFRAYDLLFDAIRMEALLNPEGKPAASFPAGVRLTDPAAYFAEQVRSAQSPALKRMWEEEFRAWRVRARELEKLEKRPSDPRPLLKRMGDAARAAIVTNRGVLLSMERHYAKTGNAAAASAIRDLTKRIATDPGAARETFQGGTYAEAVERQSRIFNTRLSSIGNASEADLFSDEDAAQLTAVLTTADADTPALVRMANPKVAKVGSQLRELLTDMYYYNRNAGLDIGFVTDQGYLPRLIDEPLVTEKADEFIKDATEVYKIVFERDTQRPTDEGVDINEAMAAMEERARQAGIDLKNDPSLGEYRDAKKALAKLVRALSEIKDDDPDAADKTDKANAALTKFLEDNADVFEEAYDYIRDQWSANAAAEYQTRISYGSPTDFSSHSPAGSYLKERTLPPEADQILAKYYIQDPFERIQAYVDMSVRKSEYNRRFGRDVRNRQEKNTKLHQILERMVEAGVRREDRNMAEKIVGQITGTDKSSMPVEYQRLLGNLHAIGQMTLLGRVVLTSLAEPITTAVQTGRPLDALKSIALTVQEIANTGSVQERRAMARALGIVAGDYADEMIANRLGGSYAESTPITKASANFFRRVGLTGLTNAQRRAAMQLSGRYILDMARDATDAEVSQDKRGFAQDELADAGLSRAQMADFGRWAEQYADRMPRYDELIDVDGQLTEMGQLYAVMVGRLVNQAVQNPSAIDRPWAANTPVGRLVYGLLSFSMAFFRNVVIKSGKKIQRELQVRGPKQAATVAGVQVLAPLATLYAGHFLVTMARELILNPDKWDDEEEKEGGFPIKWLSQLAFSRAGFTGLADPIFNAFTGVKYQRDLSNLFVGATGSFLLQAVERIAKFFAINSENTNSAERGLARGLFELTIQPGLAYATGALPGGPVVGYGMGASYMYLTSPAFKSQWQDWMAGEKEQKKSD